jgi:hypothetical protein
MTGIGRREMVTGLAGGILNEPRMPRHLHAAAR